MKRKPRLQDRLRSLLLFQDESPHRIALTFAFGAGLGVSPFIGFHTLIALAIAWVFRLNRVVLLTAVWITNPLNLVPIYTFCIWLGARLLGVEVDFSHLDVAGLTFLKIVGELKQLIMPFFLGSTIVGILSAVVSYFLVRKAVEHARHEDGLARTAEIAHADAPKPEDR
jgi:hypothetical protein